MIQVAVVGVGGWGKNLARNYSQNPNCSLKYICDLDEAKLRKMQWQMPGTKTTMRFDDLLEDRDLQAIVIATTASTHSKLCKAALLAGKDVYVEKPFVLSVAEAEELIQLAREKGRVLMVGHLLEYHPVVNRLKQMIESRELGDIYYIYNQRVNLGTVRQHPWGLGEGPQSRGGLGAAGAVSEAEVHQDDVRMFGGDHALGSRQVSCLADDRQVVLSFDECPQARADDRVVVDEHDPDLTHLAALPAGTPPTRWCPLRARSRRQRGRRSSQRGR